MKTSAQGRALIEAFEGRYLKAYQDSVGVWTIGYGHTSAAGEPYVQVGMTITEDEADRILATDLGKVEKQIEQYIKTPLNQAQFDALVSFTFNLGPGNLSKSSLCRRINAGDYDVANEFLKWDRAGGKVLNGLTRRRRAEAAMWGGNVTEAMRLAGVKVPPPDVESIPKKTKPTVPMQDGPSPIWAAVSILFKLIASIFFNKRS